MAATRFKLRSFHIFRPFPSLRQGNSHIPAGLERQLAFPESYEQEKLSGKSPTLFLEANSGMVISRGEKTRPVGMSFHVSYGRYEQDR